MNKKILIPMIIVILVVIVSIILLYVINSQRTVQIYKKNFPVLISNEESDRIIEFYNNTEKDPLEQNEMVDLIVIDEITLKVNDGNKIGFSKSYEDYANFYRIDGESYLIKISKEFQDYIFSII